jgi:hypothetical protein
MTETEIKKVLRESSCPYLASSNGCWIDVENNKIWDIPSMDSYHRKNCITTMEKATSSITSGWFLDGVDFDKSDWPQIKTFALKAYSRILHELKSF